MDMPSSGRFRGGGGAVEVRATDDVEMWYDATVEDISEDGFLCSFVDGIWPQAKFPLERVRPLRRQRPDADLAAFAAGDVAERRVPRAPTAPAGWRRVRVEGVFGCVHIVSLTERGPGDRPGCDGPRGTRVVRREELRPSVQCSGAEFMRITVPVDKELRCHLRAPAVGACTALAEQVVLEDDELRVGPGEEFDHLLRVRVDHSGGDGIVIMGTKAAVSRARAVVAALVTNELRVALCQDVFRRREEALENRRRPPVAAPDRNRFGQVEASFVTDAQTSAWFVGPKGRRIESMQVKYGVGLKVHQTGAESVVYISGPDEGRVQAAKSALECIEERMEMPVTGQDTRKVLSKVRKALDLVACYHDMETGEAVIKGTRELCELGVVMVKTYLGYTDTLADARRQLVRARSKGEEQPPREFVSTQ